MEKKRYRLFDSIRGLAVVNMVIFHFLYDVNIIYGRNPSWYGQKAVFIWQQGICWTFILLSGFVWRWGRKTNLKRGIFLNICGLVITLVTYIVIPEEAIWFGILNLIGCAVLIMIPLDKVLGKIPPVPGIVVSFFLFLLFRNVQEGILSLKGLFAVSLPRVLYNCKVLTPLGFPFPGFLSSDYFPLFPWLFLYMTGYFLFALAVRYDLLRFAERVPGYGLAAIGRVSVWVYLLHQPAGMLLCLLLFS